MTERETSSRRWKSVAVLFILLFAFCCAIPEQLQAADNPVSVSYCKLNSSGKTLYVKAKVKSKTKQMGSKLYLLGLNAYHKGTGTSSGKPIASVKAKKGSIKFKVKYNDTMLYKKFAVAYKTGGKYKIISSASYITNPENKATYKGSGPKTYSKKGLQVEDTADSLELGVQHAVINWTLSSLVRTSGTPFQYMGKTYYFDESLLQYYDNLVKTYNDAGAQVTVILLLPNDGHQPVQDMSYGGGALSKFSSIKTSTKAGSYEFQAIMTYLAQRYGTEDHLVSGWIVGNEVNSPSIWNYGGGRSLSSYMDNYARTFRICYNAVKSVNKNAKVYISLDNNWNKDADGSGKGYFTSKSTLDTFYKKVNGNGKVTFNIAYHAYPQGMRDPVFWDDSLATNSTNSKIINFKNLSVLTNYVKKNYGKNYTIMLSEQSFNSTRGENYQAAAYAYAYYISEANSMIESFIYGREFDHPTEGYAWGLCDGWRGKRLIWNVFQYIDSKDSFKFTNPLKRYTKLSSWKKISGFKDSKIKAMPSKRLKAEITSVDTVTSKSVAVTWNKILSADGYEIYRWGEGDSQFNLVETVTSNTITTYTDTNVSSGKTYFYKVRMYKGAPDEKNPSARVKLFGSLSDQQSVKVTSSQVQIDQDKTSVSGGEITIGWDKVSGISGYEIVRSTSKDGTYSHLDYTEGNTYTDKATSGGVTYYYKVRSYVTTDNPGKFSDVTSATASIQLTAQPVNGVMTFGWTQWLDAPRYRVYCSVGNDDNFVLLQTVTGFNLSGNKYASNGGRPYELTFTKGQTYYFRARAYYADKVYGDYSNVVKVTIGEDLDMTGSPDTSQAETEMPSTETPPTENPSTETPSTETPPTTPSTETPPAENPATETPSTEKPATETPSTEKPSTETPSTEKPSTETPSTENPSTEAPSTEKPATEVPSTENHPTEVPSTENKAVSTEMLSTQTVKTAP